MTFEKKLSLTGQTSTQNEISKAQGMIQHCNEQIAELQTKVDNITIAEREIWRLRI
jgi:uncharacterized protein HemX